MLFIDETVGQNGAQGFPNSGQRDVGEDRVSLVGGDGLLGVAELHLAGADRGVEVGLDCLSFFLAVLPDRRLAAGMLNRRRSALSRPDAFGRTEDLA